MSGFFYFVLNSVIDWITNEVGSGKGAEMKYDLLETGKRIKKIRKANGLTQEQFAEKFNVSVEHVGRIETGKRGVSIDLFVDISCAFDVSLDYLILGINKEK